MTSAANQPLGIVPGGASGPVIRDWSDGTTRVLKPKGVASNPSDWVVLSGAKPQAGAKTPEIEYDSGGLAYRWTDINGTPVLARVPTLDNPAKAAGFRPGMTSGESARLGLEQAKFAYDQQQDAKVFDEGIRQFNEKFTRDNFNSDRTYNAARDEFAKKFVEDARQFDLSQQGMNDRANLQESGAYQRAVLNEQGANSRAALSAQTSGFNTMAQLTPQLGRLALEQNEAVADRTRKPSDFLARAFSTRGGTSPMGMVTQADLINDLSGRIEGFNSVLAKYNPNSFGGFTTPSTQSAAVQMAPRSTPAAAAMPESTYVVSGPNAGALAATEPGRAKANDNLKAAGAPSWLPGFNEGGVTREPMFKVGEEPDGSMNDTSEVIVNPEHAPIGVISNAELTGETQKRNNPADDMEAEQEQKKAAAIGKVMQFVDDPKILHALVDEMDDHKKKSGKKMPGFASGTGYKGFGFNSAQDQGSALAGAYNSGDIDSFRGLGGTATDTRTNPMPVFGEGLGGLGRPTSNMTFNGQALDRGFVGVNGRGTYYSQSGNPVYADQLDSPSNGFRIPGVKTTTQAELQALELANRPPAITSILNGQRPTPLNLGFSLPTPGLLNTLTPDEKEAFGTTLATQYNLSPSDVEAAIRQRFGGSGARSARF